MAGGAQAKMSTWFSKPNQSLISKVTKNRVGFNLKIFVFALLKTVHCRAERNPGRIWRLFNCNDRGFLLLREAPKPKFLPENFFLRSWKLSKTKLRGILDVFCDYLTAKTGVFCYCGRRPSQNFYLKIFVFPLLKTVQNKAAPNSRRILRLFNCNERGFLLLREAPNPKFLPKNFCVCALENCPTPSWAEFWTYFATI